MSWINRVEPAAVSGRARRRPSARLSMAPTSVLAALTLAAGGLLPVLHPAPSEAAAPPLSSLVSTRALPTAQIDGVAWTQVAANNRVFVGGSFGRARPAGAAVGTNDVARTNLMSYNLTTGVMDSFAPAINGQVKNLAFSPDKKTLYAVGTFTKVGTVTRNRIAAFDVATGKLTSFAPNLNGSAYAILPTAKGIYVGGAFNLANNVARSRTAAFTTAGGLLPWAPTVTSGDVRDMLMTPDTTGIILGGNFTKVDGSSQGYGLALVGYKAGNKLYPMPINDVVRNGSTTNNSGIYDLASDANGFYGTGWGNSQTLEGTFRADWKGNVTWINDCHGDSYSIWPTPQNVYVASHAHYCANVAGFGEPVPERNHRAMAYSVPVGGAISPDPTHYKDWAGRPRPDVQPFFPDIDAGTFTGQQQGAWTVSGSGSYILFAGEFTKVNGVGQQGLVRFASRSVAKPTDGPQLASGYAPKVTAYANGVARVRWPSAFDRDAGTLSYTLLKTVGTTTTTLSTQTGPASFWVQPSLGVLDTGFSDGQSASYQVKVTDPDGNVKYSNSTNFTYSAGSALTPYNSAVLKDNPDLYWIAGSDATPKDIAAGDTATGGSAGGSTGVARSAGSFHFAGGQSFANSTSALAPNTMSVELWFRSTSTTGGAIVTNSRAQSGNSPLYASNGDSTRADRAVYLDDAGRVNFGLYARSGWLVTSPKSYNDGAWHHVVATVSPAGMVLFIDGVQIDSEHRVFGGVNAMGYWRVGGDLITGYPTGFNPTTSSFTGDVDQISIFQRALTPTQVAAHYAAR